MKQLVIGRAYGSRIDMLSQLLTVSEAIKRFPNENTYAHVEIGSAFGSSIITKLMLLTDNEVVHSIVGIDPLDNYYGSEVDEQSGEHLGVDIIRDNIAKCGLNSNDDRLKFITKYSTDASVIKDLENYAITTLLIDGDHSYEGVKYDWDQYHDLVVPGGFVIFDDYNEPNWPGVKKFAHELLSDLPSNWRIVGEFDTTLILERKE